MTNLERALKNEAPFSLVAALAKSAFDDTIRAFRGLVVQVRPVLVMLGLDPPPIPFKSEGSIALWFMEVTGRINSLLERLRQVLRTEGEHIVNLVGNLILHACTALPPTSCSHKSLKDLAMTRPGEQQRKLPKPQWLRQWVTRCAPGA
jgi:hypothetical protein